jgi:hypothetical protein
MNHWFPESAPPEAVGAQQVRPLGRDVHHGHPRVPVVPPVPNIKRGRFLQMKRMETLEKRKGIATFLRDTFHAPHTSVVMCTQFGVSKVTMDVRMRELERQGIADHIRVGDCARAAYRTHHYGATTSRDEVT